MQHCTTAGLHPDRLRIAFDDHRLVANAGLIGPLTVLRNLGFAQLAAVHVRPRRGPGTGNVADKLLTLTASALVGGDCIDDADALRSGGSARVLGFKVKAPSTLGTFLRNLNWGNVRQLDGLSRQLLRRAFRAGAGPGDDPLTIDLDSTICQTFGLQKQGGNRAYDGRKGFHPLLATAAGTGDVLFARLRAGSSNPGRGSAHFLTETIARVRAAGASGQLTVRADSGFYNYDLYSACRKLGARFSISARQHAGMRSRLARIAEADWTPIPYWREGYADVAEIPYVPFRSRGNDTALRLIVRRVRPAPGSQLALLADYSYHPFITDRGGDMLELESDHRRHAAIENHIKDLKYGMGLNHFPSGNFAANAAWLWVQALAHNLCRWQERVGMAADPAAQRPAVATAATRRRRLYAMPGRITRSGRISTLHLPAFWPWANRFEGLLARARTLPVPT